MCRACHGEGSALYVFFRGKGVQICVTRACWGIFICTAYRDACTVILVDSCVAGCGGGALAGFDLVTVFVEGHGIHVMGFCISRACQGGGVT